MINSYLVGSIPTTDTMENEQYPLTEKEQKLWEFVKDLNNWRPPSIRDMCKYMDIPSKGSMFNLFHRLASKGYLEKKGNYYKLINNK